MRRLGALLAVAIATLALGACGSGSGEDTASGSEDSGPITLGFAIGESGFMVPYDEPARIAAELAMDDINAEGGVEGRKLKAVSADTKSEPERSGDAATAVLDQGADVVITSCDFDQGSPAAIVAQEQNVLAYSTCAASTAFGPTGIGPLAFTMATASGAEGAAIAEWAYEKKGMKTAYVLLDDTLEFTKQSAYGFANRWEEIGGKLLGEDTFKQEDQSVASQINKIKALPEEPDAIYLTSYMPGQASVMKQLRSAGLEMPILAEEDVDGDYWKEAIPDISDVYYTTYASIFGDDPDPEVNQLIERFTQESGKAPETAAFLTGYATVQAIAKAIEGAGGSTDGAELGEQLEGFDDEPLLLPTTYNSKYHITLQRSLRVLEIQDGKTSYIEEWTPEVTPIPEGQ